MYSLSNLFCKNATVLSVRFLNFFEAIRFLPILHKSRDKFWNQIKVVIGNSLEMFCSFNYTNAQFDSFSRMLHKDIVAPAIYVQNLRWIFHPKPCFNLRVKKTPTLRLLCFARKLIHVSIYLKTSVMASLSCMTNYLMI